MGWSRGKLTLEYKFYNACHEQITPLDTIFNFPAWHELKIKNSYDAQKLKIVSSGEICLLQVL